MIYSCRTASMPLVHNTGKPNESAPRHERGRLLPRSLNALEADHLQFKAIGNGDIRKAKEYNNANLP